MAQVNIQAYLLWEQAGRPDGADFAGDARSTLEAQARAGKSVEEIEAALKAPEPQVPSAGLTPRCRGIPFQTLQMLQLSPVFGHFFSC